jgi:uncharacterized protein YbjT (DUF2867 family)
VRTLVFGATGFVGREVVRQLRLRSESVVAHIRPGSVQRAQWLATWTEQGAEIDESPWQSEAIVDALSRHRPDVVMIVIGTTVKRAKIDGVDGDIYQRVDFGLTKLVCDAIAHKSFEPMPRVVYLSSMGADPKARSAYLRARGQAEVEVQTCGASWAIARPAIITGERDDSRPGERVGAIVGDAALFAAKLFGAKKTAVRYRSTTQDILASALIRLATVTPANRIFDGADLR